MDPGSTTVLTSSYRISMDFSLEYIYPDTRCMPYMPPHRPPLSPRQVVFGIYTQNTEHVENHAVRQSPPGGTDRPRVAVSRPSRRSRERRIHGSTEGVLGPLPSRTVLTDLVRQWIQEREPPDHSMGPDWTRWPPTECTLPRCLSRGYKRDLIF